MKTSPNIPKDVSDYLWILAEQAVTIPVGEKSGRWTREARVMLVWSALCAMVRANENEKERLTPHP